MDREVPLRSHKFMPGPVNLMKHFACSIICSASQTASPFPVLKLDPVMGSVARRSSLPSVDREVRRQALTRGFQPIAIASRFGAAASTLGTGLGPFLATYIRV